MFKKLLAILTAVVLLLGTTSSVAAVEEAAPAAKAAGGAYIYGGPADLNVANDEKLIEMLKKDGTISEDASPAEAEAALRDFLSAKAQSIDAEPGELAKQERKVAELVSEKVNNKSLLKGNGIKKGLAKKNKVANVEEEAWDGEVTEVKVLALLVEFPDFPHNSMTPEETDNYYEDFSTEYYDTKLLGDEGFLSPLGEHVYSMKQYYEEQSGGSFTISGQVAGWYTAANPAVYYGENDPAPDGNDARARDLAKEAMELALQDPNIVMEDFDKEDRYDLDGDGEYMEPDGMIDHVMIFFAGAGEEAGGGRLGGDAVWSHSWNLPYVMALPGTEAEVPYWGGELAFYDYTMVPEDAGTVMFHEFGHDLGLPDEYDTIYSGSGEPVEYWALMASGNWTGKISGTEASGFSPRSKQLLQAIWGGNWLSGTVIDFEDIDNDEILIDQASTKGTNNDVVRINLPDKETAINTPPSGQYEYYSGRGNSFDNSMTAVLDLTNASNAELKFKTWYQIEQDYDYASVKVDGVTIPGNITTEDNPYELNPGYGITGDSEGWVDAVFDLSAFAGKEIELEINYWTDGGTIEQGFYLDDISVTADGSLALFDDAESDSLFDMNGFTKDQGISYTAQYYLVEWRNHQGVDTALAHIKRGSSLMSYDPGMLIWYNDDLYTENWTGIHPGEGYVGLVDADQHILSWSDKDLGTARYQIHDAAFNIEKSNKMFLEYPDFYMRDNHTNANPLFDDSKDYLNSEVPESGRNIPNFGLKLRVIGASEDQSVGKILIFK